MPQSREVVVTGLGAVCPLGVGREAVWASLSSGKSGVRQIPGEMPEFADDFRNCIVDGVFHAEFWAEQAMKNLFPLWMLKYLPNMAACHIGIASDARGPNNSIVEGGASSLLAFLEASQVIIRGHADVMICGGSGSSVTVGALAFRGWEQLSKWTGPPDEVPRPFDVRRDGTVFGEGSGMYILEAQEHAEARGAKILARFLGGSRLFEAVETGKPSRGTAIAGTIAASLSQAKLQPRDIGFVSAAASGSVEGDAVEAQAIERTMGQVPVTAFKSYCGDIGPGSGSVELVASILALQNGSIPPTKNYSHPDKACPVNVVRDELMPLQKGVVMALNQSITGQAAAVILGAP
ncbi:MAG: beta-ketoacyl-[acyl-carrier-protein] synthase family protein [Planctomycetales bacterium]|nr:beta-ketoacyl-[acyl-carrier-protein] synthase family protein [Planctomycetales bacterium]